MQEFPIEKMSSLSSIIWPVSLALSAFNVCTVYSVRLLHSLEHCKFAGECKTWEHLVTNADSTLLIVIATP